MLATRACRPVFPAPKRVAAVHCASVITFCNRREGSNAESIDAHKRCMREGAGKATKMDEQQAAAFAKLIELTDKIEPGKIIVDLLAIEDEAKKPTKGCHAFRRLLGLN
jgi:hypothetical protein